MTMQSSSWRAGVTLIAGILALGIVAVSAVAAVADGQDEGGDGSSIVVTVRSSVPTPAPGPPASPTPASGRGDQERTSGQSGSGSLSGSSDGAPDAPGFADESLPTLADDAVSVGGVLYVSGLSTQYVPSIDPSQGHVRARFTVLNVSTTTVDSHASFALSNFLGNQLSAIKQVDVLNLKPKETRVVSVTLPNAGQWAFETAKYTLTSSTPASGKRLPSVSRDVTLFFVPWLVLAILLVASAAFVVARIIAPARGRQMTGDLVGEPA